MSQHRLIHTFYHFPIVGATTKEELHFIYEGHPEFQVFPTFVVVPGFLAQTSNASDWPGANLDFSRLLHGEHYIELFNSIPADGGKLRTETRVLDILDKGKAALIIKEGNLKIQDKYEKSKINKL